MSRACPADCAATKLSQTRTLSSVAGACTSQRSTWSVPSASRLCCQDGALVAAAPRVVLGRHEHLVARPRRSRRSRGRPRPRCGTSSRCRGAGTRPRARPAWRRSTPRRAAARCRSRRAGSRPRSAAGWWSGCRREPSFDSSQDVIRVLVARATRTYDVRRAARLRSAPRRPGHEHRGPRGVRGVAGPLHHRLLQQPRARREGQEVGHRERRDERRQRRQPARGEARRRARCPTTRRRRRSSWGAGCSATARCRAPRAVGRAAGRGTPRAGRRRPTRRPRRSPRPPRRPTPARASGRRSRRRPAAAATPARPPTPWMTNTLRTASPKWPSSSSPPSSFR